MSTHDGVRKHWLERPVQLAMTLVTLLGWAALIALPAGPFGGRAVTGAAVPRTTRRNCWRSGLPAARSTPGLSCAAARSFTALAADMNRGGVAGPSSVSRVGGAPQRPCCIRLERWPCPSQGSSLPAACAVLEVASDVARLPVAGALPSVAVSRSRV